VAFPLSTSADSPNPFLGTVITKTAHSYSALVGSLRAAIGDNKMGVVACASATIGAKNLGITIAGIEAPLRYYITKNGDETATLTYRKPSSVFAPNENADLDAMALELDETFARIAAAATGG